jgi:hypothetical protein
MRFRSLEEGGIEKQVGSTQDWLEVEPIKYEPKCKARQH